MNDMKKVIIASFFALAALSINAQTAFDKVYQKYAGNENITTVEISQKLFALCASAVSDQDAETKQLIEGLKGIKIIVYENIESAVLGKSMYKEFESALPSDLEELMTVNSDGDKVKMLGRIVKENIVDEMILLVEGDGEFVMIQISGTLDFTKIGDRKSVV